MVKPFADAPFGPSTTAARSGVELVPRRQRLSCWRVTPFSTNWQDTRAAIAVRSKLAANVGASHAGRLIRDQRMRIKGRIVVISLILLSTASASSGANYIREDAIVPWQTTVSASVRRVHLGDVEAPREQPASRAALTTREKKTLAVLLLMLRDGRGTR